MAYLRINNKLITTPLQTILEKVRKDTNNRYLKVIQHSHSGLRITCPFHADGQERNADCYVNDDPDSELYGVFHCFACGAKGYITDIIKFCFQQTDEFVEDWLCSNFTAAYIEYRDVLPEIKLEDTKQPQYLKESEIDQYKYFHPYMFQRGLTEDVIRKFSVGYDEKDNSIVFPVWDERGNLLFFTKRLITKKQFFIPNSATKPIYLLNFLVRDHITTAYVAESQFNALTLWSWGYPAIALFGTGSKEQYEILNRSGIRNYILCFDGDTAGDNGAKRFIENINDDCIISIKHLPRGMDVNDLTKDQFDSLEIS